MKSNLLGVIVDGPLKGNGVQPFPRCMWQSKFSSYRPTPVLPFHLHDVLFFFLQTFPSHENS